MSCLGYSYLLSHDAVGEEALFAENQKNKIIERQEDAASSIKGILRDIILDLYSECSESDWDGYGATAISENVIRETLKFIYLLPLDAQIPDVIPEPSGNIGLLWRKSSYYQIVLSISRDGFVSYGYILGKDEGYGRMQFFNELPDTIRNLIKKF